MGRTDTGRVEGYSKTICPAKRLVLQNAITLYKQGSVQFGYDRESWARNASYNVATYSQAGTGSWCARAWAWEGFVLFSTVGWQKTYTVCA